MSAQPRTFDPITLEVVRNRLESVLREMESITLRTARSPVVYNGKDLSCALFTRDAQLLGVGAGSLTHLSPMMFQVRNTLESFQEDVKEGDIFIGNDPYDGGTHLNDTLIFMPVYYHGELVAFAGNRMHYADIAEPRTSANNYRDSGAGCWASRTSRSSVPG